MSTKKFVLLFTLISIVTTSIFAQIPSDGLVAHYTFDNTLNDATSGYNLTSSGSTYEAGEIDNAFLFTGSEECSTTDVNFRRVFDSTNSWSVNLWFNSSIAYDAPTGYGDTQKCLLICDGLNVSPYKRTTITADGRGIVFSRMLGSGNGGSIHAYYPFVPDTWYHVSLNFSGNDADIYINGVLTAHSFEAGDIGQDIGSVDANTTQVTIGGNAQNNAAQWQGNIDQVRVYNRTLTFEEVKEIYEESGRSISDEGLVAYYPFNGNANDESGNGNDGTVNEATLTTDRFGNTDKAYWFDGVNDFINLDNLGGYSSHTFTGWFKIEGQQDGYGALVSKLYNDLYFAQNSEVRIDQDRGEGYHMSSQLGTGSVWEGTQIDIPINPEIWHHFAYMYDDNEKSVKVYLDNDLVDSIVISGYSDVETTPTYIGARPYWNGPTAFFYNGKIDDVRIYNRTLNAIEVNDLLDEGRCIEIVYDTIFTEVFDTTYVTIQDTITTEVFDTTYVTFTDSISVTDTLIIDAVLTGIAPPDNTNTLKIYPNPAKDHIFINTGDYGRMFGYQLRIIDQLGATVFETYVEEPLYEVNLSTWTGMGLYYVQVIDSGGNIIDIRKIILQ